MECFSHDRGSVVRMAQRENPNEIDEYVNPFCTNLDEIGSFQSYCIGHFEHEWLDALGQMIAEGRVPITDAPKVDDPSYNEANGLKKMRSFVDAATINRKD